MKNNIHFLSQLDNFFLECFCSQPTSSRVVILGPMYWIEKKLYAIKWFNWKLANQCQHYETAVCFCSNPSYKRV